MSKDYLTTQETDYLKSQGWDFFMTGPNEGEWMKYDSTGKVIARQGDVVWATDLINASIPKPRTNWPARLTGLAFGVMAWLILIWTIPDWGWGNFFAVFAAFFLVTIADSFYDAARIGAWPWQVKLRREE